MRFRSAFAAIFPVGLITVAIYLVAVVVLSTVGTNKSENKNSQATIANTVAQNSTGDQNGQVLGCNTAGVCTNSYTVTAGVDDGKKGVPTPGYVNYENDIPIGHPYIVGETRSAYMHFPALNIPAGAVIDSATIKFTPRNLAGGGNDGDDYANSQPSSTIRTKMIAQKIVDAPSITSDATYNSAIGSTLTTNFVTWGNVGSTKELKPWHPSPTTDDLTSPDLKNIITELIGQGGWGNGAHAVNIFWRDDGTLTTPCCSSGGGGPGRVAVSYEGDPTVGTKPILNITWHMAPPTDPITPSPTAIPPTLPACAPAATYGGSSVGFSWTASTTTTTGYEVNVSTSNSFTTFTQKTVSTTTATGSATGGSWSGSLQTGGVLTLNPATTYYWRVIAKNGSNFSAPAVGASFSVPACFYDLHIDTAGYAVRKDNCDNPAQPNATFGSNETLCQRIRLRNYGNYTISTGLKLGLWLSGSPGNFPNCSVGTPATGYGTITTISPILPGNYLYMDIIFVVGDINSTKTAGIYADPDCNQLYPLENNWSGAGHENFVTFSYNVVVPGWFNATGGDVGAGTDTYAGDISVRASGKSVSDYLLASSKTGVNSLYAPTSRQWQIKSTVANNPLPKMVPSGSIYDYFNQKFRDAAETGAVASGNTCASTFGAGNFSPGYYICTGGYTLTGPVVTGVSGKTVVFVDGDLNLNADYFYYASTAATNAIIFVVSGNVNVAPGVKSIVGSYIVKGAFNTGVSGDCLVVKGSVYANMLNLQRTSTNVLSCDFTATSSVNSPAETFAYDPKFLYLMNQLFGISSTSWSEIAP